MVLARAVILLIGLLDVGAAAALLLVPEPFYGTIAEFPPFNRHYAGDAGSFLMPIGVGLLAAARDPQRYQPILLLGVGASWLHALNHLYDALTLPGAGQSGLLDAGVIAAIAVALTGATFLVRRGGPAEVPTA